MSPGAWMLFFIPQHNGNHFNHSDRYILYCSVSTLRILPYGRIVLCECCNICGVWMSFIIPQSVTVALNKFDKVLSRACSVTTLKILPYGLYRPLSDVAMSAGVGMPFVTPQHNDSRSNQF
ncbi:hypothetical protein AVEN_166925-1 [Araneus ventricosus]|uniref:Uncharacterized protein n=1 Tax=Araneus ventricosus TaxID=182803 RepID=A0A4Y2LUX5_ARAVE|nr:hypothetical protein AVEN_166925-1 [Araneus ventricosus]